MTEKQVKTLKAYHAALTRIARAYASPARLKRSAGGDYGLQYVEALEMSYENIQQEAQLALKRHRMPKLPPANPAASA